MNELMTDITLFMREHTDRELTIEELANKYGYSKFHFSREFKKALGVSPNEYWAALKMEQSLTNLERSKSILNAQLKTGYQSTGTFTTSFQKATGFTPGQYQEEIQKLDIWNEAKKYEEKGGRIYTHYSFNKKDPLTFQKNTLTVKCNVPEGFKGLLFSGLFMKPIPNEAPMIGKATTKLGTKIVFDQIPDGEYYALACGIQSNANPLTYFLPKYWLCDLDRTPYVFPLEKPLEIELTVREKRPTDPAITINFIKLLVDSMRIKD